MRLAKIYKHFINIDNINYISSDNNNVIIHLNNKEKLEIQSADAKHANYIKATIAMFYIDPEKYSFNIYEFEKQMLKEMKKSNLNETEKQYMNILELHNKLSDSENS
jgi:hypothetical protein